MRRSVVIVFAIAVSACCGWAPAAGAATCSGADTAPDATSAAHTRAAIACLLDAARARRHAPGLRREPHLRAAAQRYAAALRTDRPLTHTGSGGSTAVDRITAAGYGDAFVAAETLGRSEGAIATPAARVKRWLADASTRRLLLSTTYRDVGIGIVTRDGVTTFVVEVARRT